MAMYVSSSEIIIKLVKYKQMNNPCLRCISFIFINAYCPYSKKGFTNKDKLRAGKYNCTFNARYTDKLKHSISHTVNLGRIDCKELNQSQIIIAILIH